MDVKYIPVQLENSVLIDDIVSLHYFEYPVDFHYSGEIHDFWELVYCDKASMSITAGMQDKILRAGQAYIHHPGQFHTVRMDGIHAANSVIFSFHSSCPELYGISDMILDIDSTCKNLIATLVKEAPNCFTNQMGLLIDSQLFKRPTPLAFGSEQLIKSSIETILIHLIRRHSNMKSESYESRSYTGRYEHVVNAVVAYLEERVYHKLNFKQVCAHFFIGETTLKAIFAKNVGCGVMDYFLKCRLNEAKKLIRDGKKNMSQIADLLNFSTVHHFSKTFKNKFGITPTEYAKSVLMMMDTSKVTE